MIDGCCVGKWLPYAGIGIVMCLLILFLWPRPCLSSHSSGSTTLADCIIKYETERGDERGLSTQEGKGDENADLFSKLHSLLQKLPGLYGRNKNGINER